MRITILASILGSLLLGGCASGLVISTDSTRIVTPQPRRAVDIPPGHYPPPGSCRIWVPGVPPGQQSPPGNCTELQWRVPPGAVLIGR